MNQIVIPCLYLLAGFMAYAAVLHFTIGLSQPRDRMQLLFAGMCLLMAPYALLHAQTLQAADVSEFIWAVKWNIATVLLFFLLFPWFIALYTGKKSPLPFLTGLSGLFAGLFVVNLTQPYSLQYDRLDGIRSLHLPWGEVVSRGVGHNGIWAYIAVAGAMVAFGYALYALGSVYRRSRRGADLAMMLTIGFFLLTALQGILVRLSVVDFIELGPFGYLAVGLVMSVALTQETQQRLRTSEHRFRSLVEQSPFSIQMLSPDGRTERVNPAWERLWGVKPESLAGYNILHDRQLIEKGIMPYIEKGFAGEAAEIPPIIYNPADNPVVPGPTRDRWVRSYIYPIKDKAGTIDDVILMHEDVTERKLTVDALSESEIRFRTIIEQSPVAISFSRDGYAVDANAVYLQMFGYEDISEVRGQPVINHFAPQCRADIEDRIRRRIQGEPTEAAYETIGLRKDGSQFPLFISAKRVVLSDGPLTYAFLIDFTERKKAEEEIEHLGFYDQLTDLPNRRLLLDRLQQAMASSARSGRQGALLLIDLNNFKTLNETLGHDIGDMLLRQVAERLTSCVGEGDTVARFGGDEFVVMLAELSEHAVEAAAQAETVGEKSLATLSQPLLLATHQFRNTSSIGATLFNGHTQAIEDLLKQADIAMYQAKKAGRNTLRFFDPEMQKTINARAALESELHKALDNQQFRLHYQIQVDNSGRPLGAEALIRWVHPERGVVSPLQFIPLAEETGLILPIGQWVLNTACAQLKTWQQNALTRNFILSVNVNAKQFHQADFSAQVNSAVQRYGIDPKLLKLELTESMLLENIEDTVNAMNALRETRIHLSLDDFGTGYSSLQYLKRLPLNQIKIDQSFVSDITTNSNDAAIVQTIIAMTEKLGLDVIAEGVETEAQREFLDLHGCHAFQGYLFGRPMPIEQFEASLKQF